MISVPGESYRGPLDPLSDEEKALAANLRRHVETLAGRIGERNVFHPGSLEASSAYVRETLAGCGLQAERHEYRCGEHAVENLIVGLPGRGRPEEILVVGAHYDSVAGTVGADDNASGVAAVLEMARLLANLPRSRTLRLVAFVNEEPPFFLSSQMGSVVYARACRKRGDRIVGMISVESVGFYSDKAGSQRYPFPFNLFYPKTGDFITFVGNLGSRGFLRETVAAFRRRARFPSEGAAAPGWVTGVGWSDHWSFWKAGYPAVMATDTAFFRNARYHTPDDTPDTLDYERLARVTRFLALAVEELAGAENKGQD
jgi:Zn-dependent M28 family amino/carboxypeptidase